jgi:vitamin B12 transporter
VLTREDIERSQAPDLLTLLARQAGIDVARTGGQGQASTVFLRGGNSTHALVLIDGVRVNPATQGAPDFAHLPLAQIERIEIVRGPRAALWGSDAIGGVIQVFTRDPSQAFAEGHAGSYGRVGASAALGLRARRQRDRADARLRPPAGLLRDQRNYPLRFLPDQDGYRNRSASLRAGTALGSQRCPSARWPPTPTSSSTRATPTREPRVRAAARRPARRRLDARAGARPQHRGPRHAGVPVDLRQRAQHAGLDRVEGARRTQRPRRRREPGARERLFARVLRRRLRRRPRQRGAVRAWRGRFGAQSWAASLRHDDNSQFGGATTGSLAWGWQAAPAWRLRASLGTAFRAPDFNELYYPGFEIAPGLACSPAIRCWTGALATRRSRLDWTPYARTRVGLSLYRTRVQDLIVFAGRCSTPSTSTAPTSTAPNWSSPPASARCRCRQPELARRARPRAPASRCRGARRARARCRPTGASPTAPAPAST